MTITWLTNTALSGARLYWENKLSYLRVRGVSSPVAVSIFPDEIFGAPNVFTNCLIGSSGGGGEIDRESVSIEARGPEVGADWSSLKSPETYVGHHKAENFASPGGAAVNTQHLYAVPPRLRSINGRSQVNGQ